MEVKFRQATKDDIEILLSLEQHVVEAERPFNPDIKNTGAHYYDLDDLVSSSNALLLVGEVEGKIVATGYAQIRSSKPSLVHEKHSYLGFMLVLEEYR